MEWPALGFDSLARDLCCTVIHPATRDRYYPFAGGLLEHTLAVTRTCLELVDRYRTQYTELRPPLNRDLVLAGAVLHEVGRVVELEADSLTVDFTVPGRLAARRFQAGNDGVDLRIVQRACEGSHGRHQKVGSINGDVGGLAERPPSLQVRRDGGGKVLG